MLYHSIAQQFKTKMLHFNCSWIPRVRGYHVYNDIWLLETGEFFLCRQESDNEHDRYAVDVYANENDPETMGHADAEVTNN